MNVVRINAENYVVPVLGKNVRKLPCLDDFKYLARLKITYVCINCSIHRSSRSIRNHWSRTKSTENIEDVYG
jgi:hypothetical protein